MLIVVQLIRTTSDTTQEVPILCAKRCMMRKHRRVSKTADFNVLVNFH